MSFTVSRGADAATHAAARSKAPNAPARGIGRAGIIGLAAALVALCAGGLMLWARYGATVFFDLLSAGFAACL